MKVLRVLDIAASLSLGFASSLLAQDVLITQEGDAHKVYEIEIGGSSIFYKLENTSEAAIQKIDKSQVLMIKYQDGRKVIMGEEEKEQVVQNEQQQEQPMTFTPEEEAEIAALNAQFVEEYNQRRVEFKEPKNKKAGMLFCIFGLKKDIRLQDNKVKVHIQTGENFIRINGDFAQGGRTVNPGVQITVENLYSQTIYVDLGNCFFVRNGEAYPYYKPSATSTTTGSSNGASVNLGSVTSALGVGGIAGTIANGVNIGGGKSSSSSTITYSQRIVAIPPKSEIKLEFQRFFLPNSKYWKFQSRRFANYKTDDYIKAYPEMDINRGEKITYTETDNTLNYGVRISYSLEENCLKTNNLHADFYLKEIIGVSRAGTLYHMNSDGLTSNWKDVLYMVVRN